MRKLSLVTMILVLSSSIFAQKQLLNFDALMASLNSGNEVKAVFHYAKCQLVSNNELSQDTIDAVGGMFVNTYEFFEKGSVRNKQAFVVFSDSKLIHNPKGDGFVYNYVKVKISKDNKVKITAEYVNPQTLEITMTENFFSEINDGKNNLGAYFYQLK